MPDTKVLLVGPQPPPGGGIGVYVAGLARALRAAGATCRVLDVAAQGACHEGVLAPRSGVDLMRIVHDHARAGFAVHLHTDGLGLRSWWTAALCSVAARPAPALVLTLYSAMLPAALTRAGWALRLFAQCACLAYSRIVCADRSIRGAVLALGIPAERQLVRPLSPLAP